MANIKGKLSIDEIMAKKNLEQIGEELLLKFEQMEQKRKDNFEKLSKLHSIKDIVSKTGISRGSVENAIKGENITVKNLEKLQMAFPEILFNENYARIPIIGSVFNQEKVIPLTADQRPYLKVVQGAFERYSPMIAAFNKEGCYKGFTIVFSSKGFDKISNLNGYLKNKVILIEANKEYHYGLVTASDEKSLTLSNPMNCKVINKIYTKEIDCKFYTYRYQVSPYIYDNIFSD